MEATPYRWSEIEEDNPIALLHRRRVLGEKSLIARVNLQKGCHVATHSHESEQIGVVLSGKVRWWIGADDSADRKIHELSGGDVMVVPSNVPHGVDALEDTEIIDILTPPGPMGIDSQRT